MEGFVVVVVVFLLITQSEDLRQSVQLGSDVGLQEILTLSPLSLQTAVSTGLQELSEDNTTGDSETGLLADMFR